MTGAGGEVRAETTLLNVPNALTAMRLVLVPLFGWMLLSHPHDQGWRVWTTAVFVVAMGTDFVDGYLARRHDIVTSFGKLADPIADKALTGMALIGLSVLGELWWWVTIVILVREWGITVLRFAVLRHGVMSANRGGKAKTVLQGVALVVYLLPLPHWTDPVTVVIMLAALVVTVATGVDYLLQARRLVRDSTAAPS